MGLSFDTAPFFYSLTKKVSLKCSDLKFPASNKKE